MDKIKISIGLLNWFNFTVIFQKEQLLITFDIYLSVVFLYCLLYMMGIYDTLKISSSQIKLGIDLKLRHYFLEEVNAIKLL